MDFGVGGFDSLLCPNSSDSGGLLEKQKWCGSGGFLKQQRSVINEDELREFKVAKTNSCGGGHHQMLSFSSPNSHTATFPYYHHHHQSGPLTRNTGYGMHGGGILPGFRGPFTPSQWMELEHQALIYKHITTNMPIPSYLLNPIRKAFESAGFSAFPALRSNPLGWGSFHLGFSSTDPEPGRCRRTDGKKWRCSRDAVADQKYCERHMNRGRHRSRKPVEGQSGHSATGITTTSNASKLTPMASSTSPSSVVPAGGASNGINHHQLANMQPCLNRNVTDKENVDGAYQHSSVLSMMSQKGSLKDNSFEDCARAEFGLVCSDSLLNPLNKSSSLVNCRNLDNHDNKNSHNSLRQFINVQPDRTQLSISIPMATSDFMSSPSSPANEKLTASPLRLSHELEMGLGVGTTASEPHQRQAANWVPISWEPSMGGPLGEVLHTTTAAAAASACNNTKPLNLIDSWDNSPRIASSPTGVLQRGAFGSLSNSSAGSSPRAAESSNGFISPGLMNPYLPAL